MLIRGVIGDPIVHSLGDILHQELFHQLEIEGKLVIKSLQNHVLNVTGLPDLDRALLQNPTIKKVLGGISENNKVKTNLLIMNHMKKGVHPNKLFPHHDAHEEHLNSIQDVIKHMKKEDLDDGFTGKRTTGATGSYSP